MKKNESGYGSCFYFSLSSIAPKSASPLLPLSCLSPSSSPCFPVIFEMRTHTVGCGDAPVSPIENLFAALMLASQNCDCLSTFFMARCQMDVSCLMKIICAQFPVPLCSCFQQCVSVWVCACACVSVYASGVSVSECYQAICIGIYASQHSWKIFPYSFTSVRLWRVNRWKWMPSDAHVFVAVCVYVCVCACLHVFVFSSSFGTPFMVELSERATPPLSFLNVQGAPLFHFTLMNWQHSTLNHLTETQMEATRN